MHESLQLGNIVCDFIRRKDFFDLCKEWLHSKTFHHVVTLNPEMVVLAESDTKFKDAATRADIRIPDGSGLIWAHWYIRSQFWSLLPSLIAFSFRSVERVTGIDTVITLAEIAEKEKKSVYLLGGTPFEVTRTAKTLKRKFPGLTIHVAPPHKYSLGGPKEILDDIKDKKPDILFVAYGAAKQTPWIEANRKNLGHVSIAIGVGGAFSILSEKKTRAPHLLRKFNLEWLWRLILEPSRLPRIWNATVVFPKLIKKQKQFSTNSSS